MQNGREKIHREKKTSSNRNGGGHRRDNGGSVRGRDVRCRVRGCCVVGCGVGRRDHRVRSDNASAGKNGGHCRGLAKVERWQTRERFAFIIEGICREWDAKKGEKSPSMVRQHK